MHQIKDTPVIEVDGLRMRYGTTDVLMGMELEAHEGEVLALLGPNGVGKTTTIEVLTGFRPRSAGHVRVLGEDPENGDEAWKARLGIVLQSWRDHRRWRVQDLLHHMGSYYRSFSTQTRQKPHDPDELLDLVGLREQARKRIGLLSGGQRRRLDVAIGLIGNPELLFLDEPTVGFDPVARNDFHTMIQNLVAEQGMSVILTTHDLFEAEKLATTIAILLDGRIAVQGTPGDLSSDLQLDDRITYERDGARHEQTAPRSQTVKLVREIVNTSVEQVENLQVHRPTLEESYLHLLHSGQPADTDGKAG